MGAEPADDPLWLFGIVRLKISRLVSDMDSSCGVDFAEDEGGLSDICQRMIVEGSDTNLSRHPKLGKLNGSTLSSYNMHVPKIIFRAWLEGSRDGVWQLFCETAHQGSSQFWAS